MAIKTRLTRSPTRLAEKKPMSSTRSPATRAPGPRRAPGGHPRSPARAGRASSRGKRGPTSPPRTPLRFRALASPASSPQPAPRERPRGAASNRRSISGGSESSTSMMARAKSPEKKIKKAGRSQWTPKRAAVAAKSTPVASSHHGIARRDGSPARPASTSEKEPRQDGDVVPASDLGLARRARRTWRDDRPLQRDTIDHDV